MIRCRDCGASQYEGTLYCSECGRNLLQDAKQATDVLPFSEFAHKPPPPPVSELELDAEQKAKQLTFVIPNSRHRHTLTLNKQIQIGRAFDDTTTNLDLTDDNGMELGVSRLHAIIQWSNKGIVITDLGSTNGTFLNNHHLPANKPYPIQSGDELRFGELLVHVFY
ncbi:MAG: FHA domain-containing protein [Anaerolineae bacterium]|nr:FHA domain-containing protein [Anaerolineae bacterium]